MQRITGLGAIGLVVATIAVACSASTATTTSTSVPVVATTAAATTTTASVATTIAAPTTSTPATTRTSGPRYGGGVVIGEDREPGTLNPYAPDGDDWAVTKVAQALHTGISDVDGTTLELTPEVLVELPTMENGGLVVNAEGTMKVSYRIRDEAQWADGVPISGDDFAFTVDAIVDNEVEVFGAPYDLIDRSSMVAGAKTFAFTMSRPTLEHEALFSVVVPKHVVEGSDFLSDWNVEPWVSGGPFVFESWERGELISLVRNDNYWKSDEEGRRLPYLDRVEFRYIAETQPLLAAMARGDLDVLTPLPFLEGIRQLEAAGITVVPARSPIWEHLNFQFGENNRNPDSLNERLLFRRAVAHAIDRDAIVDGLHHEYSVGRLDSVLTTFTPDFATGGWARYDHDPARARALLAQLCDELARDCVANPPQAVFSTTHNADVRNWIADRLQEMLAQVGIDLRLELEDSAMFFGQTLDKGDWDLGLWAWVGTPGLAPMVSILGVFDPDGPPPAGSNFYRWGTPAVTDAELMDVFYSADEPQLDPNQGPSRLIDEHTVRFAALVNEAQSTISRDELRPLIQEAESILADQVVIIPIMTRLDAGAYWADRIAGYVRNGSAATDTWNIEYWYRVGG